MKYISRIAIALIVFVSGAALIPFVGLPTQGPNWQRYANVYNPAMLSVNHASGQPGSYFTIMGANFSPNTSLNVSANGQALGAVQTTNTGDLLFRINSTGADPGFYRIEASGSEVAATQISLQAAAPQWPSENTAPVLNLPAGIARQVIFLPVLVK